MLSREQVLTITFFIVLFLVLYMGCDTKSPTHKLEEKSRAQNFELISMDRLEKEAIADLPISPKTALMDMRQVMQRADSDSIKVKTLKSMASLWYANGQPLISGHYAEKVAEIEQTPEAWNIAGTTYSIAMQQSAPESNEKEHAVNKSRQVLENALSMSPENINTKINLALTYVEAPLEDNPMKGILMLVGLNKEHPENTSVLFQLGRLSIQTGQFDKAVARLTKVVELRPTFLEAHCLLAEAYKGQGQTQLAKKELDICNKNI